MNATAKTVEFTIQRTIPAPPQEVYDAWLDSTVPGTPWNLAEKFMLDPRVDGLFYWHHKTNAHYGRFLDVVPGKRLHHTWVSRHTLGLETLVTVTFEKSGTGTKMTLVHSELPDTDAGRGHEQGWNYFLDLFPQRFGAAS
jgi:uncharacterized protein YndB with AHSA1/START domain